MTDARLEQAILDSNTTLFMFVGAIHSEPSTACSTALSAIRLRLLGC